VWEHRDLVAVLSRHRIRVRYRQSVLGGLWAVLQPFAMMAVFTVVFSRLVAGTSDGVPYALFAYAGILPWTFFATALSTATTSLVTHGPLITKVYFPREILPLTYVIAASVDLLIGAAGLVLLLLWFDFGIGWGILSVLPVAGLVGLFAFACALVLSAVQVHLRDIGMALPVALQLWMFASPVLYPLSAVPEGWRWWYLLNPMAGLIDSFRRAAIGQPFDPGTIGLVGVAGLVLLPLTYVVFKQMEATLADVI
jgi:lipopolysaccharide transport system permease protein